LMVMSLAIIRIAVFEGSVIPQHLEYTYLNKE